MKILILCFYFLLPPPFSVVCISFTPSILFPKNCYIGYLEGHIFANLNFMGTLHFPLLNF